MAATANIERDFKRKVSEELKIVQEGLDRFLVITPLTFSDGDVLPVVLKKNDEGWLLTDEGHTFMELTYELEDEDLRQGTRKEIIDRTLLASGMENRNGELILPVPNEQYGDALYSFLQALLKIDDVRYLSRERTRSTFFDDFHRVIDRIVSPERTTFNWHDMQKDPDAKYPVDCRINGSANPVFVFALPNDDKVNVATISLLNFEKWNLSFKSVGIFEEQEKIHPKTLARFLDVCEKTFSNLAVAGDRFTKYFPELRSS